MLNLYKNYIKNNKIDFNTNKKTVNTIKNFPSSIREWNNSIYVFNKNSLNLIPESSKVTMKLIKNYFNLYNSNLEVNLRKEKLRLRFKKLSSNKIYVSNGTFKHTNNEVIITLYVYNRQKINYTFFIKRKFNNLLTKNITNNLLTLRSKIQDYIKKKQQYNFRNTSKWKQQTII